MDKTYIIHIVHHFKRGVFVKKRTQFASNKLFNFCMVVGFLFAWVSIDLFISREIAWGVGVGIAALLFIVPAAIFTPYCYAFDCDGVSLCYLFLPVERYVWSDIHAIEVEDKTIGSCTRANIFDFFYAYVFAIKGKNVGKTYFYMNGHIRKSFRTKHLLEQYWDGTITGYLFEDVKNWIDKRKTKKQAQIEAHLTDEIVKMEREIRAEARMWLQPFLTQAKQYDLEIKVNYRYITNDFEEYRSRPKEGYTYTLVAEIAHANETDENRIVVLNVDLLYVRLGKTSYRGVENEHAEEELKLTVSDALHEIHQNGIDVYCKNL